jgi:hypothetical protein
VPHAASNNNPLLTYRESSPRHQMVLLSQRLQTTLKMFCIVDFGPEAKETTMREWRLIVDEIGLEAFDRILDEHLRESRCFPTIAELRERAGLSKLDQDAIEINQAWEFVCRYVQKWWHPEVGRYDNAPAIPPRIDYALCQIGGLYALHNCSLEQLPRMHRDFADAYRLATLKNRRCA